MPTDFDFSERVVLVTGASGALGSGVCEAFQRAVLEDSFLGKLVLVPENQSE